MKQTKTNCAPRVPPTAPSSVRELHVEAFGVGYVLLKWLPPDQPNGVLQGYDIAYQHSE